jgi:hypothetical protein
MKNKENKHEESRVELKYCEHCGSLWLRQCGEETVYCPKCLPQVADMPTIKKKSHRVILPVRSRTAIEDFGFDSEESEGFDFDAAGGVA